MKIQKVMVTEDSSNVIVNWKAVVNSRKKKKRAALTVLIYFGE